MVKVAWASLVLSLLVALALQQTGYGQGTGALFDILRVNMSTDGQVGNSPTLDVAISANGRVTAFTSGATNLVSDDTNNAIDVFVRDLDTRITERISLNGDGTQATADASHPMLSANGQLVAFETPARLLPAQDTNDVVDTYLYDRTTHTTELISRNPDGTAASGTLSALSDDGRWGLFHTRIFNNGQYTQQLFLLDRQTQTQTRLVTRIDGQIPDRDIDGGDISADGRWVAFSTRAANIVAEDQETFPDIFLLDRATNTTTLVTHPYTEGETTEDLSNVRVSANGQVVIFQSTSPYFVENDTNGVADVFVYDHATHVIARVSVGNDESQANAASTALDISAHGQYILFASDATTLVAGDINNRGDIFRRNRATGETTLVSQTSLGGAANDVSDLGSFSADGTITGFRSAASNLVPDDTNGFNDMFVIAPQGVLPPAPTMTPLPSATQTSLPSATPPLTPQPTFTGREIFLPLAQQSRLAVEHVINVTLSANDSSSDATSDRTGTIVAFSSLASNLVAGDTNGVEDIFVWYRDSNQFRRVTVGANGRSYDPHLSENGRYVVFTSDADTLIPGDTNGAADVFRYDLVNGNTALVSAALGGGTANDSSGNGVPSADGNHIAFISNASNMTTPAACCGTVYVRDMVAGVTKLVPGSDPARYLSITADGTMVTYQRSEQLSPSCSGPILYTATYDGSSWSPDTLYRSEDTNDFWSLFEMPALSATGRYMGILHRRLDNESSPVRHYSDSRFVRDLTNDTIVTLWSLSQEIGPYLSPPPECWQNVEGPELAIAETGDIIAFVAPDLSGEGYTPQLPFDTNGVADVYVYYRSNDSRLRISIPSVAHQEVQSNGASDQPFISADGRNILFTSGASNLQTGDSNGATDIFLYRLSGVPPTVTPVLP